ncbi:hypothetical protein [Variovorax arabinosiphilus]|uniref:hypothetical protein n=1 Tax=Variovorax arabinosiphilus TaxID=3053498 RepID=UPI0025784D58|nr:MULTISPECIES: hypothetical protein [unclassified Variovorax]MDM0118401.1 hypothetical protein [Variovorax sp. J2L1-78]MDM0128826.1 hypothetical protein [Variovorax sp. J2L1-63]MDM0233388.1 hypothetical protein [Variovorax sp. J2R1-6]
MNPRPPRAALELPFVKTRTGDRIDFQRRLENLKPQRTNRVKITDFMQKEGVKGSFIVRDARPSQL